MSAASFLAQLAPMAAPSGDGPSAASIADQDAGAVFAGLMAAEALASDEAAEANTAEGPVEAAAVDASQPLVSSAMLMALQPRPAPVPVAEPNADVGVTEDGQSADGPAATQGQPMQAQALPAQAMQTSGALGGSNPTPPGQASTLAAAELASAEAQQGPSPAEAKAEADLDAQVAKALAAAQSTLQSPPAQTATSSAALAAAAVANRSGSAEVSNASAARSAEDPASESDDASLSAVTGEDRPSTPAVAGQTTAASASTQAGSGAVGTPAGASAAPQPAALAAALNPEAALDGSASAQTSGGNAPAAPASTALPSVNTTAFSNLAQASIDTTIHLAAQITRRLEGRSTRFEMGLTPEGLGRVDVKLDIDAGGRLTARLAFDNPLAATELRGRADELRRELQDAGFDIAHDGLEFSERQSSSSGQSFDQQQGRAFAGAARLNAEADLAQPAPTTWMSLNLTPRGVDMKV